MKLHRLADLCVLAVLALLAGWGLLAAAEAGGEATPAPAKAEAPAALASLLEEAVETPMTPVPPPPPNLEPPPAIEASCHTEDCGNTGTLYGYGNSCTTARADLDAEINAAADWICPGVVTGIVRHYGSCTSGWPVAECKYSGDADIECKICPGEACA